MARTPFYGRNDTKIARMDMQAATAPGRAYRDAFENLGKVAAGAIEKYAQNKKEGEAADMQIGAILQNMTPERQQEITSGESELGKSLSKFIDGELSNSKKKALLGSLMTVNTADQLKRKEQMDAQRFEQQQELTKLNMQIARQNLASKKSADQLKEEARIADNQFMQSLMSQTTSPQAQRQADIARPGLPALGNADARNRFMQAQLQQPQNQVPVSSLGSQDFGRFAREQGLDPTRSVQRMEALRQAELANQPKPLSPSDQLAREKYEDQKAEDVEQTETAKIESTNNLTDFYNETKSLLDKINEKGVDVTGPIEGTSIYRFFSKLGDTNDEQVRRRLEMFTRKLTLDAAQNLKGALSDKDIRFLVEQAPDMDDNPSVWKKYMGDLVLRLERNANQQGIELGVSQTTPASQSILDEIERKKQLRSKRAGL